MNRPIHLVANYRPDGQLSMQRYADCLERGLREAGVPVEMIRPEPILGRFAGSNQILAKWLGYVDKLILFPLRLRSVLASPYSLVHITDHSNAFWVPHTGRTQTLITCHDMMAILSAQGKIAQNRTRLSGRLLQRHILNGLRQARHMICISHNTEKDLRDLVPCDGRDIRTILYQLNHDYQPLSRATATELATRHGIPFGEGPVILYVGNNSWYKNRDGMLRAFKLVAAQHQEATLLVIGDPFNEKQLAFLSENGLENRVRHTHPVNSEVLAAAYSLASVFLFPSYYEGFGWPPIEAQACGCPVVSTHGGALGEVLGDSALIADPDDHSQLANHLLEVLRNPQTRDRLVAAGQRNVERFRPPRMVEDYLKRYRELLA